MLTNAFITRIDRAGTATAVGKRSLTQGSTIGVRCFVGQISSRQHYTLGATLQDADRLAMVRLIDLANAGESKPQPGDRLTILLDGDGVMSDQSDVITVGEQVLPGGGGNSHYEIFMRRLPLAV
jgi:hypothetical protein